MEKQQTVNYSEHLPCARVYYKRLTGINLLNVQKKPYEIDLLL